MEINTYIVVVSWEQNTTIVKLEIIFSCLIILFWLILNLVHLRLEML